MTRRQFIAAVTLILLDAPLAVEAQPAEKVYRIGTLGPTGDALENGLLAVFRHEMAALGYVEGKNVRFEHRSSRGQDDRLPELVAELVRFNVDVLVTSAGATRAAKRVTSTIPIVFTTMLDPVAAGIVVSLAHPGGNVTGSTEQSEELSAKRLDLLKQAVPHASRMAVLMEISNFATSAPADLKRTLVAAEPLRVSILPVELRGVQELEQAFATMIRDGAGALIVLPSGHLTYLHRRRIIDLATKSRLPSMYAWREGAEAGALMSYGINFVDQFRRAALYVDKILKGAKPADLPVEQPTKFELVINLKTAKALGLTISPSLLARADEPIQ